MVPKSIVTEIFPQDNKTAGCSPDYTLSMKNWRQTDMSHISVELFEMIDHVSYFLLLL